MSSYRGAWDGGPPGAEGEYAPPPAPPCLPATDPWTGASYSAYGNYDYSAYGAAASYYGYDPSYYQQRPDGTYFGKYPEAVSGAYPPPPPGYDYSAPAPAPRPSRSRSPLESRDRERRRSYNSKSRSASPYDRRERSYSRKRDGSYEDARRRRSRSSSHRKKYSSSDRSSSRSRTYSRSNKDKKKRRHVSSDSSASENSYKKKAGLSRHSNQSLTPPPKVKNYHSRKRSESPGTPDSNRKRSVSRSKNVKPHSSRDKKGKDKQRDVTTPPRKKKSSTPPRGKKSDRGSLSPPRSYKIPIRDNSLTPPRTYKYKDRNSNTPPRKVRDSSVTPPKSYARSSSSSSKSGSKSPQANLGRKKVRDRRSPSPSSDSSGSSGSSRSSRLKSKRKIKRKSKHRSRSKSRSKRRSRSRSKSHLSKAKTKKQSASPDAPKSRSRSRSRNKKSQSGTPSEDERRGQFTVTDRKRYWKEHNSRQEEIRETRTPPKEVKPPPGAVESTKVDDIEYGDPPDVVGPNFAELLHPPDMAALAAASISRSKAIPIIKNDGSFLEMFKKMQEATKKVEEDKKPEIKKPTLPFIGKRRGGRVLKTGLVKKAKAIDEQTVDNTPKDAWSLYMQEVKKYRETSCEEERKTRPLVK